MTDPVFLSAWERWAQHLCAAVGVPPSLIDRATLRALAGAGSRAPMDPVSASVWGLARAQRPSADPQRMHQAILSAVSTPWDAVEFDAVILAGGRGSRLGGADKAMVDVGGETLLSRALRACDKARSLVVVGPVEVPDGIIVTREDPPGTGPAAGLAAGLEAIDDPAEWTLALACDLPGASLVVPLLLEVAGDGDAYCIERADGGNDWLLALYRSAALRQAFATHGDPRNCSVGRVVGSLAIQPVPSPSAVATDDIDTWEDHARWAARLANNADAVQAEQHSRLERICAAVDVDPSTLDGALIADVAGAETDGLQVIKAFILGLAIGDGIDPEQAASAVRAERGRPTPS